MLRSYKEILSDEHGQEALKVSGKFNGKVLLIKKQLGERSHPLNVIMSHFDQVFFLQYSKQIQKGLANINDIDKELTT